MTAADERMCGLRQDRTFRFVSGNCGLALSGGSVAIMRISPATFWLVLLYAHPSCAADRRITAGEVVDRETLKTFVQAAAAGTFREALQSDDDSRLAAVKNAFRVEGGDWKHVSVYVYVVNEEGFVLFHGGDVSREDRMLDLEMEDRNGVKFIRKIMAAGVAGGGYVEYYWDNPAVEGDEVTGRARSGRLRDSASRRAVRSSSSAPAFTPRNFNVPGPEHRQTYAGFRRRQVVRVPLARWPGCRQRLMSSSPTTFTASVSGAIQRCSSINRQK